MKYTAVLVWMVGLGASVAQAGLFQDIYRGLGYTATPLGGPLQQTADGGLVNGARSGRLRIVPSGAFGQGYELQYDRTYGADSRGRPETLYLGGLGSLTLNGSVQATAGYNGFRDSAYKAGRANFSINNLAYNLRTTIGGQDAQLTGVLNATNNIELNTLGFYTASIDFSNTNSQLTLDGVVVRDTNITNFDVGPINIKGNIFADGLAALTTGLGGDASGVEQLFPQSPISVIDAAIREQLQARAGNTVVAGTSVTGDPTTASLLLSTIVDQDEESARLLMETLIAGAENNATATFQTPEPGTLLLVAVGGLLTWSRRLR